MTDLGINSRDMAAKQLRTARKAWVAIVAKIGKSAIAQTKLDYVYSCAIRHTAIDQVKRELRTSEWCVRSLNS